MEIVAGLSLKQLKPRVWIRDSPYYLPGLRAVMVSYADFHRMSTSRKQAMEQGLHEFLQVPEEVDVYLDNGAFYFLQHGGDIPAEEYEEFVTEAQPDWWPIPQDYIPTPQMSDAEQRLCFRRTMRANLAYEHDGYVPVIHISNLLEEYSASVKKNVALAQKTQIALGGIVPNLLRAPKAMSYSRVFESLRYIRQEFPDKSLHVFGMGGTATIHIAMLLGVDTVDSAGWRNRAARGLVQLPGTGDRVVAELGSWRGKRLSDEEMQILRTCACPSCQHYGLEGLQAKGSFGFCNRATHNLWILLNERDLVRQHLEAGTYEGWWHTHLDNTVYRPLIQQLINKI